MYNTKRSCRDNTPILHRLARRYAVVIPLHPNSPNSYLICHRELAERYNPERGLWGSSGNDNLKLPHCVHAETWACESGKEGAVYLGTDFHWPGSSVGYSIRITQTHHAGAWGGCSKGRKSEVGALLCHRLSSGRAGLTRSLEGGCLRPLGRSFTILDSNARGKSIASCY